MKFIRLSASGASGFYPRRDSSPSFSSRSSLLAFIFDNAIALLFSSRHSLFSFVSFSASIALLFSSLAKLYCREHPEGHSLQ